MSVPAWFDIHAAVVAALQATAGYGAPDSSATTKVFAGPLPTSDIVLQYVVIGDDGEQDGGQYATDWLAMGARADGHESGDLNCLVAAWDGQFDNYADKLAAVQTMCADLASAAYSAVAASTTAYTALTSASGVQQIQSESGLVVRAKVVVHYETAKG